MHLRLGQWLMGVALGYLLYKVKDNPNEIKISKVLLLLSCSKFHKVINAFAHRKFNSCAGF